jgi:hypothetical protein
VVLVLEFEEEEYAKDKIPEATKPEGLEISV